MENDQAISVSNFIDLLNQSFEYTCPVVNIIGELANFRISKNKWVYFDLKDEKSSLKFFGTVYQLHQPLEDGMMLQVTASPNLHSNYGFSMQIQEIRLVGEGTIKKATELLRQQLSKEGLFDQEKKRQLNYPPQKIGLITSLQSAAYADFMKILNNRWKGIEINFIDVQVQGEIAINQIESAIDYFNKNDLDIEVLVIIRGGGSPEDLAVFNTEEVTRAIGKSRIPTLVAIGHEIDLSLAELAADQRASTPSNAAELMVPEHKVILQKLTESNLFIDKRYQEIIKTSLINLKLKEDFLKNIVQQKIKSYKELLKIKNDLLTAYNPVNILKRGFAIVRLSNQVITSNKLLKISDSLDVQLANGRIKVKVSSILK